MRKMTEQYKIELIADCEETLDYWQKNEQQHPNPIAKANIEYFAEFIKYIQENY